MTPREGLKIAWRKGCFDKDHTYGSTCVKNERSLFLRCHWAPIQNRIHIYAVSIKKENGTLVSGPEEIDLYGISHWDRV